MRTKAWEKPGFSGYSCSSDKNSSKSGREKHGMMTMCGQTIKAMLSKQA
jgi:hypothetical protein